MTTLENECDLHLIKYKSNFPLNCPAPSLVQRQDGSREENFKISSILSIYFYFIFPWESIWFFIFNKLKIPITQECCVQRLLAIGPQALEKKIIKLCQLLLLFCHYLPLKTDMSFRLYKLDHESLYLKHAMYQFGCNWLTGSGEQDKKVKSFQPQQQPQQGTTSTMTTNKFRLERPTWAFSSNKQKKGIVEDMQWTFILTRESVFSSMPYLDSSLFSFSWYCMVFIVVVWGWFVDFLILVLHCLSESTTVTDKVV